MRVTKTHSVEQVVNGAGAGPGNVGCCRGVHRKVVVKLLAKTAVGPPCDKGSGVQHIRILRSDNIDGYCPPFSLSSPLLSNRLVLFTEHNPNAARIAASVGVLCAGVVVRESSLYAMTCRAALQHGIGVLCDDVDVCTTCQI